MPITPCVESPPTPGIVTFDPVAFVAAFPMFTTVPGGALTANFGFATMLLDNSCCSIVKDAPTRAQLLNLVTAHITALFNGVNGQPPQGVVGRINAATEGSVSVQTEMLQQSESAAFWQQTQWGALFWAMTVRFRTARYVPPCDAGFGGVPWNAWPQ
jgi:Protein of unknown function (DUF4054)